MLNFKLSYFSQFLRADAFENTQANKNMFKVDDKTYCATPPSDGGVETQTKFSKRGGGLDRNSTFRGGLLGKKRVTFLREGCNFHIKN